MLVSFFVAGQPIPQPRPRVSTQGGFARAYVPRKHKVHKWQRAIAAAWPQLDRVDGTLWVELLFTMPRPKAITRKRSANLRMWHATAPDVDNLVKAVLDALNSTAWADDGQIAQLTAAKRVAGDGDTPGALISIHALGDYTT